MKVQIIKDGPKNFSVLVKGFCISDFTRTPIIDLTSVTPPSAGWKGLRLDSAAWAIQEKLGFHLWWDKDSSAPEAFALVMESRNAMRFDEGIPSPRVAEGWKERVYLSSFRANDPPGLTKWFFLLLDFDKQ